MDTVTHLEEMAHSELKNAREKIQELQTELDQLKTKLAWAMHKLEEANGAV